MLIGVDPSHFRRRGRYTKTKEILLMMLILLTMAKPSIEGANLRELREDSDTDPNDYADVREFQYKEHFSDYEFPEAHKRHSDKPIDASKPEKFYGAECSN